MKLLKRLSTVFFIGLTALFMGSCGQSSSDQLVVYSGRSQVLVDKLVEDFKAQTDIDIEVRYGNDAELLAVMNEEGDQSPADVYWANTTGALAQASEQGMLKQLPDSLTSKADAFQSKSWPMGTGNRTVSSVGL
ncbi:MAG: substrate-binding domain-containing protein [Fodinibius sp.]|nr:substrate-binding domain-containing protein [Fodinibius sp.]